MSWNWYETQASQIANERLQEAEHSRLAGELRRAARGRPDARDPEHAGPAQRSRHALGGFLRALGNAIDPA